MALVCSQPSEGHDHWALRPLQKRMVEWTYVEAVSPLTITTINFTAYGKAGGGALAIASASPCGVQILPAHTSKTEI